MFFVVVVIIIAVVVIIIIIIVVIVITIVVVSVIIIVIANTNFMYSEVVNITLESCIIAMFVIQKNILCLSVSEVCVPNFTFTSSSDLLVTAVKPKSRVNVQQLSCSVLYPPMPPLPTKNPITNIAYFSKIYYHMSYLDAKVNSVSVATTSQVGLSAILLLTGF
jgi:hypothetical protein